MLYRLMLPGLNQVKYRGRRYVNGDTVEMSQADYDGLGECQSSFVVMRDQRRKASPKAKQPTRCGALTKAGKPCKAKPLAPGQFCRAHG